MENGASGASPGQCHKTVLRLPLAMRGSGEAGGRAPAGPRLGAAGMRLTVESWGGCSPLRGHLPPPSAASLSGFLPLCPPPKGRPQPPMPGEEQAGPINCAGQTEIKRFHPQAVPQMRHARGYVVTHEPSPCVHAQTGFSLPQQMVGSPSPYLTGGSHLCLQGRALV